MRTKIASLIFLITSICISQNGLDFKVDQQLYLRGNSALIGNTILGTSSTKAHNSFDKFNDALDLKYTDVDNDKSTFSSSQAKLNLSSKNKVKYAALYWSAIYKYDVGIKTSEGRYIVYKEKEKRLDDLNKILFKTPNDNYKPINGTMIFDSYSTNLFEENKPYVCYADVTSQLQNAKSLNGTFTVANIKATQGYINGGSSGGWLLYVVYENEDEPLKYFTTYNGFIGVDQESLTIDFKDFKTPEYGPIKPSLLIGSLEGDHKLKTDRCEILSADKKEFIPLSTSTREENNFFNSTITSTFLYSRNPHSANTLGFDLLKMDIPNQNNQILSNNLSETSIKLSTKKDGFYLFFVAFETEISEDFTPKSNTEIITTVKKKQIKEEIVAKETTQPIIKTVDNPKAETKIAPTKVEQIKPIAETTVSKKSKEKTENNVSPKKSNEIIVTQTSPKNSLVNKQLVSISKEPSIEVSELPAGFYLITNVFSVEKNAINWTNQLTAKGYDAKTFINPKNNWHYVYILNNIDATNIIEEKQKLLKNGDFKDLFIKKINL